MSEDIDYDTGEIVVEASGKPVKSPQGDSKALEVALAQLQRQYGSGAVMRLGNTSVKPWESIATGEIGRAHV